MYTRYTKYILTMLQLFFFSGILCNPFNQEGTLTLSSQELRTLGYNPNITVIPEKNTDITLANPVLHIQEYGVNETAALKQAGYLPGNVITFNLPPIDFSNLIDEKRLIKCFRYYKKNIKEAHTAVAWALKIALVKKRVKALQFILQKCKEVGIETIDIFAQFECTQIACFASRSGPYVNMIGNLYINSPVKEKNLHPQEIEKKLRQFVQAKWNEQKKIINRFRNAFKAFSSYSEKYPDEIIRHYRSRGFNSPPKDSIEFVSDLVKPALCLSNDKLFYECLRIRRTWHSSKDNKTYDIFPPYKTYFAFPNDYSKEQLKYILHAFRKKHGGSYDPNKAKLGASLLDQCEQEVKVIDMDPTK